MERHRQPAASPETRQRNLVEAYGETMQSILDGHEKMMDGATDTYASDIAAWNDSGHGRRKFDRLLAGTAQGIETAAGSTATAVEQAAERMYGRVIKALSPADRKVLEEAQRIAEEEGVESYRVSDTLRNGSTHEAQEAMDAALDRDRIKRALQLASEQDINDYRIRDVLHSGSRYSSGAFAAQWAMDAALDVERLVQARDYAREHGVDHYRVSDMLRLNRHDSSWYAAGEALDAALDAERLDQARARAEEHGHDDYRVKQALHSGNRYGKHWFTAQEALDVAVDLPEEFSISAAARKLGRQAVQAAAAKKPKLRGRGKRHAREDDGFDRGTFTGGDPFEGFFRQGGFGSGGAQWERRHAGNEGAHGRSGGRSKGHSGGSHSEDRTYEAPPPPPRSDEPNPYEVLGVARDASQQDIKRAYRDLARQHHPDMNEGREPDEEAMKRINNAYDLLGKPETREYFDKHGHTRGM